MSYPLEEDVSFSWDTGILSVPAVLTPFETDTRYVYGGDVVNPTADELTYTVKNTLGDEIAMTKVPAFETVPVPISPLRPCEGLQHVGSDVGLKVQLWGQ